MEMNELRKIAEAATPGPWEVMDPSGCASWIAAKRPSRKFVGKGMSEQDAEHIATFDPPTVLALLTRLEQAERNADTYQTLYEQRAESLTQAEEDRDKLRNRLESTRRQRDVYRNQLRKTEQQVARVRELHWRRTDRAGFYADSGKPIFRNVCGYCNDDQADGGGVPYPCDTIIALDGDTRRLADQGLGDNLARTTKNGETNA